MPLALLKLIAFIGLAMSSSILLFLSLQRTRTLKMPFGKILMSCANFPSGISVLIVFFLSIPLAHKILIILWKIFVVLLSHYNWKKPFLIPALFFTPAVLGFELCYILGVDLGWIENR